MIIVDLNQIMYSSVLHSTTQKNGSDIDDGLVRHIALNILRSISLKFKHEYGELVIATDSYKYWRKEFFPYYKANRKKARDKSPLNWQNIFLCMNNFKADLKELKLYKYVEVEGAEADDVIASLVDYIRDDLILIVSGDKDFAQLQKYSNVKQYDALNKKFLKAQDPVIALEEHIIKGDASDGIPNILSSDNCLVLGQRQKKITKKVLDSFLGNSKMYEDHSRNHMRNKTLIDLNMIPERIKKEVIENYKKQEKGNRSLLFDYLAKNKLSILLQSINDF